MFKKPVAHAYKDKKNPGKRPGLPKMVCVLSMVIAATYSEYSLMLLIVD